MNVCICCGGDAAPAGSFEYAASSGAVTKYSNMVKEHTGGVQGVVKDKNRSKTQAAQVACHPVV